MARAVDAGRRATRLAASARAGSRPEVNARKAWPSTRSTIFSPSSLASRGPGQDRPPRHRRGPREASRGPRLGGEWPRHGQGFRPLRRSDDPATCPRRKRRAARRRWRRRMKWFRLEPSPIEYARTRCRDGRRAGSAGLKGADVIVAAVRRFSRPLDRFSEGLRWRAATWCAMARPPIGQPPVARSMEGSPRVACARLRHVLSGDLVRPRPAAPPGRGEVRQHRAGRLGYAGSCPVRARGASRYCEARRVASCPS